MSRQVKPTLDPVQSDETPEVPPRRRFIGTTSSLVAAGALTGLSAQAEATDLWSRGNGHGSLDESLKARTLRLRTERAIANHQVPIPRHQDNDDEERYPNLIGTDTRGLPHNARGEVDLAAWATLKQAVTTRTVADFEKVKLGGVRKLVNPLGTLGLNLTGLASNQIAVPSAPALASAERASDAVEIYWQSLLREVPFHDYRADTSHALLRAAAAEISQLPGYVGPRNAAGQVTPDLLFRGTARYLDRSDGSGRTARTVVPPGVAVGPYISQFLLLDVPYGVSFASALIRTQTPANEFLSQPAEWLAIQNGQNPTRSVAFDNTLRYLSTGRDLAEVARGSAGAGAALQILSTARSSNPLRAGGIGAALSPTNPYLQTVTTSASAAGSFAAAYLQGLLPLGVSRGIRAAYWLKWFVHRTLRPEAYGGLVHQRLANQVGYPLHASILQSEAVSRSRQKHGTFLLSHAYPEGAPIHSSYPGGASVSASVQVTLLKAFFDENTPIPNPVQPDPLDPTKLIPYTGPTLTVGGELNKLATNLGVGRNWAGIHWRSDAAASLALGEEVAISLLRDEKRTFAEPFEGFRFTRFDGSTVVI